MNTANTTGTNAYSPSVDNLRKLLIIRSIALLGQTGVLAFVVLATPNSANLFGVITSLSLLAALTLASLWRTTKDWPVADEEFLTQLLIDVIGWTVLMYFTGGANNPFISYYIVPLVISAAVLPSRHTWMVAGASMTAYSLMLFIYQPFPLFTPHAAMGHGADANMHILGMWFNFLFSVGLITFFVVRMASSLRRQEELAVTRREDHLRNDQIMAVASLAAGTAHELGTPLATMTVLVGEMLADEALPPQTRRDCELLRDQLLQCKTTLAELSRTAELSSVNEKVDQPIGAFACRVLERWAVRRPGVEYHFECAPDSPELPLDPTMEQALENLLNNAADSGTSKVEMTVDWNAQRATIAICDRGTGIPAAMMKNLGKPIIHPNPSGLGIGLMLSQATVQRSGGNIELHNRAQGGVCATLSLPINSPGVTV